MKKLLLLSVFAICSLQIKSQQIERVEPPNWWAGMKRSELQILVYGKGISKLKTVIDNKNMRLDRMEIRPNPNYIFLYVRIRPRAKPGIVPIKFYKEKKLVQTYDFELKQRKGGASAAGGFTTGDAIYLVTPDRFANGDPSNDEFADMPDKPDRKDKAARHGGDIKGIENQLGYISDLGFTAIWLNPVIENDMKEGSYHGYAATDFYKVDRRFGTNEEYVNFIEKAKEKGLKVIMDMILNHSGSLHWFVLDPPTKDWLNNQGDYKITSHIRQTVQDIHASEYDKKAFSDGWFVESMPDLNQKNKLMADYLIQNTLWWIEYSGISGIRMDTYPYPDKDFMSDWTCAVTDEYPNFSIVGEEWTTNPAIVSYWQRGKANHDGYTSCLPNLMDFPMQSALSQALVAEEEGWNTGLIKLYEMLANDFLYSNPDDLVIFPDNHDMDRFFTQVNEDVDLFKMGLVYIATMRGIPQLYYGTEIGMDNTGFPGDHYVIRTDFPGGWQGDPVNAFSGQGLSEKQADIKNFTKKLLAWRKTAGAIHHGNLIQFAPEDGIYSFVRTYQGKQVLVILSKVKEPANISFSKYSELIAPDAKGYDVLNQKAVDFSKDMEASPKSAYIIEINP